MSALSLRPIPALATTITPAYTGPLKVTASRQRRSRSQEKPTWAKRKSASFFHAGTGPRPDETPMRMLSVPV